MNNRRLSLLVLVVVGAVIASVQWYLAAETAQTPPTENGDEAVLESCVTLFRDVAPHG